jgi:copper chaperone CopZ
MPKDPADPHNLATSREEILQTAVIATEGLYWEHSAERILHTLRGMRGVVRASADVANARVSVTFDPTRTDVASLHERIELSGYRARALANADLSEPVPAEGATRE